MADLPIFTYQTRVTLTPEQAGAVEAWAELFGRAERSLFAALCAGRKLNDLKREFLPRFGLTARQFNAIRIGLEGKIDSIRQRRPELIADLQTRIKRAATVIKRLELQAPNSNKLHQKKRRSAMLESRLKALEEDQRAGKVRLCFGSRKLFRSQFDLVANDLASHEEWQAKWRASRARQIFILGSSDETAGNQTCQAAVCEDGTLSLKLRLPDALAGAGKHLVIEGVRFAYGHENIVAALCTSRRINATTKDGKPVVKRTGTAISYRFLRDEKGWRVFLSCAAPAVARTSHRLAGAVGIDINADHLALAELDRFGNPVGVKRLPLPLYGKRQAQAKALIGDAAVAIANRAREAGKSVVLERLDFSRKKAEIEGANPARARQLSSFACNKVISSLKAACFRVGVEVIEVNPAYTSAIGAVNHAQRRGVSVHQGAAIAIARRGMGLSERATVSQAYVPARSGGHVTFVLPVRNRSKHVWAHWSNVRKRLRAALAAHVQCGAHRLPAPPLLPAGSTEGATWASGVKSPGANRHQHCSGNVLTDVPY